MGTVGSGILLAAVFVSSILLVTNFTLAGFLSHFDVAWENLRIRIDEWRDKRRTSDSGVVSEAKARAEKRRAIREHQDEAVPPTISVGEVEAMAAAVGRSTPLFDEQPSLPTVGASDNPFQTVTVREPRAKKDKPAEDAAEADDDEPAKPV